MSLVVDLFRALGQFDDPRFLRAVLGALALTIAALAAVFAAVMLALGWLVPDTVTLPWIGPVGFLDSLLSWAAVGLMLLLSVVLMVPAAAAVVGFFLDDVAEAVEAVPRAAALDRRAVRARARERFDVERMVDGYLDVYHSVLGRPGGLA